MDDLTKNLTEAEISNSLTTLIDGITTGTTTQVSQVDTLFINQRWYLISNYRQLLSQLYTEHGLVQTLIDQPVDDGYRSGFDIKTGELDADDIENVHVYLERNQIIQSLTQAIKWARLFGGGAILVLTDQDPTQPLNIKMITKDSPLEFRAVDMWELYNTQLNVMNVPEVGKKLGAEMGDFYNYYGMNVHKSRVIRIEGKEPTSFIKPRLRGWGMSEVEKLVRSLNQYMKNQNVIFDLLDEAKIDVYKMDGLNDNLFTADGTKKVTTRIQHANTLKNYNNAITLDAKDDYIQKQINFTGLSDVLIQIRQGIAADLKMPMTKLFGISAAGFNSGEDDIENYNSMIESEVRAKTKYIVADIVCMVCQKLFGIIPDDLQIKFKPLRILSALEEEQVKEKKFNRVMSSFQSGLASAQEAKESINADSLLGVELDPNTEALPPIGQDFSTGDSVNKNENP